ncbi:MAG: hypothetical protein K1X40_04780 [Chitinophagales bacterium]|nr:hypothetical protein [Chitinophagales bacterium]
MQEFTQWAIFMGFIALMAAILYAYASGWVNSPRTRRESFKEWQKLNGGVVRMMSLLIILVCVIVCIYKYNDIKTAIDAPPTLQTE